MLASWAFFVIMAVVLVAIKTDTTDPHTTVLAYGTNARFDCNISQSEEEAVWGRTTSKGYQLLYAGLYAIRAVDANNIKISHENYSLFLYSVTIKDEGIYVCNQAPKTLASYRVKVAVNSEIRIQHKGHNLSESYFGNKGEELQLHCVVFRTRETPLIEWKIENWTKKSGEMINSSNTFIEGTFDFRGPLTYIIEHDTEIICSSFSANNQSVSIKFFTVPFQNPANSSNYTALLLLLLLVVLIVILPFLIVGGCLCLKRYQESYLSAITRVLHSESTSPPSRSNSMDNDIQITPSGNESLNQLSRGLPEVPNHRPSYARNIAEEDYYSAVSYNLPTSKVFLRKRLFLISRLSDGVICERWVGNVKTNDGKKSCALISRWKGVLHFEHFSWDKLVKRLLELPENPHIFKVKGMCFDEPHLFLLQDYMTCESLAENFSITTYGTGSGQEDMDAFVSKLTNISLQVCNGMEFAMSYELSHPDLSTSKILINEFGICKMYDFCLTGDASKFLECLKTEPKFSATNHPPECVARSEYTCASDVWYTAHSVREIYSVGSKRIPCDTLTKKKCEIYSLQPRLCPHIVYERITECMTPSHNDRPQTVRDLLTVLKELISAPVGELLTQVEEQNRKYSSYLQIADDNGETVYSLPVKYDKFIS